MASKSLRGLVSHGSELPLLQDLLSCLRTVVGCVQGRILLHICYRDAPFCPTILPELCLCNFFFLVSDLLIWKLLKVFTTLHPSSCYHPCKVVFASRCPRIVVCIVSCRRMHIWASWWLYILGRNRAEVKQRQKEEETDKTCAEYQLKFYARDGAVFARWCQQHCLAAARLCVRALDLFELWQRSWTHISSTRVRRGDSAARSRGLVRCVAHRWCHIRGTLYV